jgi:hypothetical protein
MRTLHRKPVLGVNMRKIALLLAAALVVSVPLIAASPTLTYGAAKAKSKAPTRAPTAKKGGPESGEDIMYRNTAFLRALSDLFESIGRPPQPGKGKGAKAGKGKAGAPSAARSPGAGAGPE